MAPTPVLHQTDIFLPPADPDDHYDLATQFALARRGDITFAGVLLDYPPPRHAASVPAVQSVAQLSRLTGVSTSTMVGAAEPFIVGREPGAGARYVLSALEAAAEQIDIHVVGSCRDIAEAAQEKPDLFAEKCRRLYLNAGSSGPVADAEGAREYNIEMDASAFRSMFDLPCETRWMPCFTVTGERIVSEYATHWSFDQRAFVDALPDQIARYFAYALGHRGENWLAAIETGAPRAVPEERRSMWCTAGFLDSAGLTVDPDGAIREIGSGGPGVFEFLPARWSCSESGHVTWELSQEVSPSKIFRVTDQPNYEEAMTRAMGELLRAVR